MKRLSRIVSYAGLGLSLVLLVYSCAIEKDRTQAHLADASVARLVVFLAGGVLVAVAIAILFACDVKQFAGDQAFDLSPGSEDESPGADAELQEAEETRKSDPLEAIRVLREYLNQAPGNAQVMTRIAEIYEKDLHNPLAAALEYEELLKTKLDSESWGRSAIHLTNLYIRLQQQDKAIALLRRIDKECGNTAAAIKARKRLEQVGG
jgi:hypothetical protein